MAPQAREEPTAAKLALDSGFPYIRVIAPHQFVGISEAQKVREIAQVFEDAYKSPEALIVVDQLERLLDWVPMGTPVSLLGSPNAPRDLPTCAPRM